MASQFTPRRPAARPAAGLFRASGVVPTRLSITGLPVGTSAFTVVVADAPVPGTIAGTTWTATGPLVGPNGSALPDGDFFLKAHAGDGSSGVLAAQVAVVGGSAEPVAFAISAPPADPVTVPMTFTGPAGWRVTLTPAGAPTAWGAQAVVGPLPILDGGRLSLLVAPGDYTLSVERAQNEVRSRPLTVSTAATVDVSDGVAATRTTQGPVLASPPATNGTLRLTGAPAGAVVVVGSTAPYTLDASGLPVEFSLPAGTHTVSVAVGTAPASAASVTVVAGGSVTQAYAGMAVLQAVTLRTSQGPTPPDPPIALNGVLVLSGAPAGSVVQAGATSYTLDASGLPVELSLPSNVAGATTPVTVTLGTSVRSSSVRIPSGEAVALDYAQMTAPPTPVAPDGVGCGPVVAPQSWMPARACPGQILVGPDGRYVGELVAGPGSSVRLVLQSPVVPEQTAPPVVTKPAAGMSDGAQIVTAVAVVAAGAAAWDWWSKRPKTAVKNPSRSTRRR